MKMDAVTLSYGKKRITCPLPGGTVWRVLEKEEPVSVSEEEVVASGIALLQTESVKRNLRKNPGILLVVPDHTRRCRLEVLLPPLAEMLEKKFQARIEVLVAAGTHALQKEEEIARLVGSDFLARYPVLQHDCRNAKELEPCGLTSRGTPVCLNRRLRRSDLVITIGGVLFHYFAGFGGGPKMIFPGLAAYDSVRANHFLSLDLEAGRLHPGCREGELDANPVYQDLAEAVLMAPVEMVSWQLLVDSTGALCHSEVGPLLAVHRHVCARAAEFFSIPIEQRADIVVASAGGNPADVDLIQAHKAIHHAFAALKPGGWMVMLAECGNGIGSQTFLAYFLEPSSAGIVRRLKDNYQLNGQTALALRNKTEAAPIILVSALDPQIVAKTGLIPAASLDEAWRIIGARAAELKTGYVFPQASFFLPKVF